MQSLADTERFEQVILPHLNSAYNFARWLIHDADEAQDVVQEACLRALEHFPGFRGESGRAWLITIVRNTCYDRLRRKQRQSAEEFDEHVHTPDTNQFDPELLFTRSQNSDALADALQQLPREFREVLVLRELEGLTYKEISAVLGIPPGTVMSRLARARGRLQEYLLAPAP